MGKYVSGVALADIEGKYTRGTSLNFSSKSLSLSLHASVERLIIILIIIMAISG